MYSWTSTTDDTGPALSPAQFRRALGSFPTGVCLVTTVGPDGKREGMTINSFASVSLAPPLVLWSIRDDARSADAFVMSRHFIISILSGEQKALAGHFARPAPDKFEAYEAQFDAGLGGCPRLSGCVATFECTTYSRYQEGDHTVMVGRVEAMSTHEVTPLVFHTGQMGSVWDLAASLPR